MGYWDKANEYREYAISHTKEMTKRYSDKIEASIAQSKIYDDKTKTKSISHIYNECSVILLETDSVSALIQNNADKPIVLNFASYTNPGGKFLEGSSAQEESLCRESFLYNVLSSPALAHYYAENGIRKNRALYVNRAILSPDILFRDKCYCAVLTCAAPNFTAASKYCKVTKEEDEIVLQDRIKFVLKCCADGGYDTLILGAFGCGVFSQNAETVAKMFKYFLETDFKNTFKKVVFAVPTGKNYNEFKKIF